MNQYREIEQKFSQALGLRKRPVAVKFQAAPPAGVSKFEGAEPSSCSFWRLAAAGKTFYTVASDHYNCAVGSHTHNIPLPPERAQELEQTLSFMTGLGYIKMGKFRESRASPRHRELWFTRRSVIRLSIRTW